MTEGYVRYEGQDRAGMRGRTGQVLTEGYVRYEGQDRAGIDRGTGQGRY